jgi:prepilin-type N-terminal cleavage/methylation domain-containing protein
MKGVVMTKNLVKNLAISKGFTLIELSIVIIIIGLLIAGVTSGIALIKQASLNKIITDARNYTTAIDTFKLKYGGYYPGDFPNASSYWPNCDPTPANCNGNGDGFVEFGLNGESFRAWQMLALSGIIGGTYNGTTDEPTVSYEGTVSAGFWRLETYTGRVYTMPAYSETTVELLSPVAESLISGADAFQIDSKIDDGIPSNGKVYGLDVFGYGCVKQADGVTNAIFSYDSVNTVYNVTETFHGCGRLLFFLD